MHRKTARFITGKAATGKGEAAFFTQLDWVQEQCRHKLGFSPYPGTLNLVLTEDSLPVIEALQREKGIELIPPDPNFCAASAFPVTIDTLKGAIIVPAEDVRIHGKSIIEVLAPVRLKTALKIADGDQVLVRIDRPGP